MAAALREQLQRTVKSWQRYGAAVIRMDPLGGEPFRKPLPIFEMNHPQHLNQFVVGCDADLGGMSTVQLAIVESPQSSASPSSSPPSHSFNSECHHQQPATPYGVFRGTLRAELSSEAEKSGVLKAGGYAGFRTKVRKLLIGEECWNARQHEFMRLRVRNSGDEMKYFVNVQTEGPDSNDIFQHRLWLGRPGEWENVLIPLADFALTNKGEVMRAQFSMPRDAIRTVGISVLEKPGSYELGIQKVECVSEVGLKIEEEAAAASVTPPMAPV